MPANLFSDSRVSTSIIVSTIIFFSCFPRFILTANVTLESIEIFQTHEPFKTKPTVYFMCKGENKTVLPDVTHILVAYTFKGEESWQPLVDLPDKKCKRCGFYEEDRFSSDDVFDEWEFCPSDFTDAKYFRSKDGEFNVTFSCPQCVPAGTEDSSNHDSGSHNGVKGGHILIVILISVLASIAVILGMIASYKYWLKKKRAQDQARFLKLFEDGDDIEDELGLGSIL